MEKTRLKTVKSIFDRCVKMIVAILVELWLLWLFIGLLIGVNYTGHPVFWVPIGLIIIYFWAIYGRE